MLKVIYNQYKGYCIPKGSTGVEAGKQHEVIYTNGFNFLNWEDDELQQYSKLNKSARNKGPELDLDANEDANEDGEEEDDDDDDDDGSLYENESKGHLNHEMSDLMKPSVLKEEINNKIIRPHKGKGKHKKGKDKNHQGKKQKKKKRREQEVNDFHVPSDAAKVKILNNLYRDILSILSGGHDSKKPKDDDKILQFFDVSVYKEELDFLRDDEWLSDNNITFMYEYLERYQLNNFDKLITNSIILLRPSMCYLLANHPEPQELKGVLPPLENSKFIFLPVNDADDVESASAGSHWSLVAISLLDGIAFIYDTLERANESEAIHVIKQVNSYLGVQLKIQVVENTPQQINGSDCGVMVCQMTGFLLSKLLDLRYLENNYVDLGLDKVEISAIDGRVFMMGTLLNLIKHKQNSIST